MALRCRAVGRCRGRTVVILGATSSSVRCAAHVVRMLGATKIVGISREPATLDGVAGLVVRLVRRDLIRLPEDLGPVHIVLDFVGGAAAVQLLQAAETDNAAGGLQYIQTGGLAGCDYLNIPARLINIKPIRIMASGVGSLSREELAREMPGFLNAVAQIKTPPFDVLAAPMSNFQSAWNSEEIKTKRLVLVP
jgi:NADPH:quinone reductase-like Zn-dependent oxidoreductase